MYWAKPKSESKSHVHCERFQWIQSPQNCLKLLYSSTNWHVQNVQQGVVWSHKIWYSILASQWFSSSGVWHVAEMISTELTVGCAWDHLLVWGQSRWAEYSGVSSPGVRCFAHLETGGHRLFVQTHIQIHNERHTVILKPVLTQPCTEHKENIYYFYHKSEFYQFFQTICMYARLKKSVTPPHRLQKKSDTNLYEKKLLNS